jgi:HK97 gp10 family phage protein
MNVLTIDTTNFKAGTKAFKNLINAVPGKVSRVLNASAEEIVQKAKRNAPADRGQIRQGISADTSQLLEKHVTSHAPYSAYIEFGTGKYAAMKVAEYPSDIQAFAQQFKGKGSGDYYEFLNAILDWVKRHHLAQITNSYTGRKRTKKADLLLVAEAIAWSIIKNGIHPHPFMIPAFIDQKDILLRDMRTMLNQLHT